MSNSVSIRDLSLSFGAVSVLQNLDLDVVDGEFIVLPAYRDALARSGAANAARVQAFFTLMAELADTNLLHRGGATGLAFAQSAARQFLDAGGVHRSGWQSHAVRVHRQLVERWLSPGGSADLLAACLFVAALEPAR